MRRCLLVLLLATGCAAPELRGVGLETEHYSIRTDSSDPEFARRVGEEAERIHRCLERHFGGKPSRIALLTLTDWQTYSDLRAVDVSAGEYHHSWVSSSYVLNAWRGAAKGRKGMAHEMVHHFVHELCPDMPLWMNEGIAEALEHSSTPLVTLRLVDEAGAMVAVREHDLASWSCPLVGLRYAPRDRGWAAQRLPELLSYETSWDGPLVDKDLRVLAAAAMRFGMETEGWRTLKEAVGWVPDPIALERWLSTGPTEHRRFKPLMDGGDASGAPFAAKEVPFAPPPLDAGGDVAAGLTFFCPDGRDMTAKNAAVLAKRAGERLRAYLGPVPGRRAPVPVYVFDSWEGFGAHRYKTAGKHWSLTRGFGWEWVELPGRSPFCLLRGGPRLGRQLVGALVERAIQLRAPRMPEWKTLGLALALDHDSAGCPARRFASVHPRTIRDVLAELRLARPELARFGESCYGLIVRFGLETQGWKTLAGLESWEPDADAMIRWMSETDLTDFRAAHTRFRPLLGPQ